MTVAENFLHMFADGKKADTAERILKKMQLRVPSRDELVRTDTETVAEAVRIGDSIKARVFPRTEYHLLEDRPKFGRDEGAPLSSTDPIPGPLVEILRSLAGVAVFIVIIYVLSIL